MANVLVIDDDKSICEVLAHLFAKEGHSVNSASTLADGAEKARTGAFDVVFLDVVFPEGNGLNVLPRIQQSPSAPEVIIMTGAGNPDGAELAMRCGAWDYVEKGFSAQAMILPLRRALQYRDGKQRREPRAALDLEPIIGDSPAIRACFTLVGQAASTDANLLITGETGVGKELFARAVHKNSARASGNFVVVDCAALPETLVESTLFGHERGAFTSADKAHDGLVKHADHGTLFLDEVGELPLSVQKTFLRVLQERRYYPVGATREVTSDFRLIAATNRDLGAMVQEGRFRDDLLFRIRSLVLALPPLRDRTGDAEAIALDRVPRLCARYGFEPKGFSADFLAALSKCEWPGNVRQLLQALEAAVIAAQDDSVLVSYHLPVDIRAKLARASLSGSCSVPPSGAGGAGPVPSSPKTLCDWQEYRKAAVAEVEKGYLTGLMDLCEGDMKKACDVSGLSRPRLYALLQKYKMSRRE
ncbi:MAG TPA: sigma-54 dependent transcriptional regulator [Candidatus Hydrogenedentes bacterium]|nr:sigma-54 dependent transcriptional regulator [Candidatus Hydrogenedentota bacterium]HPG67211.1 sigma-54 dependent transcriptional regulator [Candidatus Hydrogenedentota bacterium]